MIQPVTMPKWGLSMERGRITDWFVAEGDEVEAGDDLADIDTDKINGTLESPGDGVLRRVVAAVGEEVPVGGTIALLAKADTEDAELDEAVRKAREEIEAGAVVAPEGPVTGTAEVGGRTLAYATLGTEGDVVVLVHGYGGDKNSWLFVQEPLSRTKIVHALDLPGHGDSTKDVGDGSLATLADAVLGFLDALGIERAHLVGHSLGGAVVTAAAAKAPHKVSRLTLVAPAGFGTAVNAGYLRGFAAATTRRELKPHLSALFASPDLVTRQLADDLLRYKRRDGVDKVLTTLLDTLLDGDAQAIDAAPLLSGVDVPTRTIWGRRDAVLPPGEADVYVDDAGHLVHLEAPGAVLAAILDGGHRG
ncbi:acetoin dehydrogenase dihydrolipoyllysine-residue acetyltransferase subunit [Amycolatopsis mongoliensis]|uniref:Acetoin dehydrogenase dihydrolipoyllysine-residue acetyltransferase subunit n=1 Tax=Amycolatopsis mongoliensis TaxID=715475 RepID=A0A9Y2JSW1_9PSEU|nr:acetoin dehydrogenase dihydrolipoyllysine-residue acetyltransferase subunit [Amycolatopsis sp. 4-36]WIY04055.1 acetoin dehydrogenase dihydrolipoyllysine-residue acetyltransferase subunit [Amycolatopsis sp. 4-36]